MKKFLIVGLVLCFFSAPLSAARKIYFNRSKSPELINYLGGGNYITTCDSSHPFSHLPKYTDYEGQFKKRYVNARNQGSCVKMLLSDSYTQALHSLYFLEKFSQSSEIYNCQYLKTVKTCPLGQQCGSDDCFILCFDKSGKERMGAGKSTTCATTLQRVARNSDEDGKAWNMLNRVEHILKFISTLPTNEQNQQDVKDYVKLLITVGYNLSSGMGAYSQTTYGSEFDWWKFNGKTAIAGYVKEIMAGKMEPGKALTLGYGGDATKLKITGTQEITYSRTNNGKDFIVTSKGTLYFNCESKVTPGKGGVAQVTVRGNRVSQTKQGTSANLGADEKAKCKGGGSSGAGSSSNSVTPPADPGPQDALGGKSRTGQKRYNAGNRQIDGAITYMAKGAVFTSMLPVAIDNCTVIVEPVLANGYNGVRISAKSGDVLQGSPRAMDAQEKQDCKDGKMKFPKGKPKDYMEHISASSCDKLNMKSCTLQSSESTNNKKVFKCTKNVTLNQKIKVSPDNGYSVIEFRCKGGFTVTRGIVEQLYAPQDKPEERQDPSDLKTKTDAIKLRGLDILPGNCVDKDQKIEPQGGGIMWGTKCPIKIKKKDGKQVQIAPEWDKNPPVQILVMQVPTGTDDEVYAVINGVEEILGEDGKPEEKESIQAGNKDGNKDGKKDGKSTNPDQKTDPQKPGGVLDGKSPTGSQDGTNDPNALTGEGGSGGIPVPDTLSNRVKQFFVGWASDGKKISYVISPFKRNLEEEERQMKAAANGEAQHE